MSDFISQLNILQGLVLSLVLMNTTCFDTTSVITKLVEQFSN